MKKTAVVGTYYSDFKRAMDIAELWTRERKAVKDREYCVIQCGEGWLVVNEKYLNEETEG